MDEINVGDRVQITQVSADDDAQVLNQVGTVIMIIDGEKYFVVLDGGGQASVGASQLKKAT